MRKSILLLTAALALSFSPAHAQLLGGSATGTVGGAVGATGMTHPGQPTQIGPTVGRANGGASAGTGIGIGANSQGARIGTNAGAAAAGSAGATSDPAGIGAGASSRTDASAGASASTPSLSVPMPKAGASGAASGSAAGTAGAGASLSQVTQAQADFVGQAITGANGETLGTVESTTTNANGQITAYALTYGQGSADTVEIPADLVTQGADGELTAQTLTATDVAAMANGETESKPEGDSAPE